MKALRETEHGPILVDDEDYEKLLGYDWYVGYEGYVYARGSFRRLHRFIVGRAPHPLVTDHINQNKLDNRKQNLRFVTRAVNGLNNKFSKSPYYGIEFLPSGFFRVQFRRNGKTQQIGRTHDTLEEAQEARDAFLAEERKT